jgi:16S rRNA (cytidine1402-2'-O)-methyltransferase
LFSYISSFDSFCAGGSALYEFNDRDFAFPRNLQIAGAEGAGFGEKANSGKRILTRRSIMLYIVATPIGNLDDITLRALEILKSADVIAAEDTRHSGNLLRHFEVRKPLVSYHEHNEAMRTAELAQRIAAGETVALITDAGMPGLSDPGARLVRKCIERNLPFTIVPGPSSILTALVGSGFSLERFCFRGFLPVKSGQRKRELRAAAEREETSVYFESPYRLTKTLAVCAEIMPERQLCIARELTKKFEEFRRGTGAELFAHYESKPPKGEITLVIGAVRDSSSSLGLTKG